MNSTQPKGYIVPNKSCRTIKKAICQNQILILITPQFIALYRICWKSSQTIAISKVSFVSFLKWNKLQINTKKSNNAPLFLYICDVESSNQKVITFVKQNKTEKIIADVHYAISTMPVYFYLFELALVVVYLV